MSLFGELLTKLVGHELAERIGHAALFAGVLLGLGAWLIDTGVRELRRAHLASGLVCVAAGVAPVMLVVVADATIGERIMTLIFGAMYAGGLIALNRRWYRRASFRTVGRG